MSAKNQRGQTSFEALGVTLAVIVLATFILGSFFELKDSTEALSIIKIEAVKQLDESSGTYYIKRVEFSENVAGDTMNFNIITEPVPTDVSGFDFTEAKSMITSKTKYGTVNVSINGISV